MKNQFYRFYIFGVVSLIMDNLVRVYLFYMYYNVSVPLCNNPISGVIHCTISPCNIAIDRNTPCVLGWQGLRLNIVAFIRFDFFLCWNA